MRRLLWLLVLVGGCETKSSLLSKVDVLSFQLAGGTLFSSPSQVTTKEIHFDTGTLSGRDVILEGEVQATGKYSTYVIVDDEFGRMLVVLTNVESAESYAATWSPRHLRIWGTVERGKKGLPYVLAKAITSTESKTPAS